jgi:hypothetical protein
MSGQSRRAVGTPTSETPNQAIQSVSRFGALHDFGRNLGIVEIARFKLCSLRCCRWLFLSAPTMLPGRGISD